MGLYCETLILTLDSRDAMRINRRYERRGPFVETYAVPYLSTLLHGVRCNRVMYLVNEGYRDEDYDKTMVNPCVVDYRTF